MKNKNKQKVAKALKPKPKSKGGGGRQSSSNEELFKRRQEISLLDNMGVSKIVIAARYKISLQAVYDDLKSFAPMENKEEVKREITERYKDFIRQGYSKKDYWLALKSNDSLAKMYGFAKDNISLNVDLDVDVVEGGENPYEGFTDKELIAEHNRQLEVIRARKSKKGKRKL